jgi:hypothetical protein
MMKRFSVLVYVTLACLTLCLFILAGACSRQEPEGFAIYLTEGDVPPSQMEMLSHVNITGQPVISTRDIISYNVITHEILLTADAFDRVSRLDVPVRGRSFVVCVDRQPVYWGAFWTPISSMSFDGITIMKPFGSYDSKIIQLSPGYPTASFYKGEDPRNNLEVMSSLQQAGKLSIVTSSSPVDRLPRSLKGYELYSWPVNGLWHFALITGTNRDKTLEEIISTENIISQDGWVHVHAVGLDAVKTLLGRVPQNEYISWLGRLPAQQAPQDGVSITLPTSSIIDKIKEYAAESGLNLTVLSP